MPIALLNRDKLKVLAGSRLEEARILLDNQLWTGSYYMAGLAVECALKACLARAVNQYDFPDKNFVNRMYIHDLEDLLKLDGSLWLAFEASMSLDPVLGYNWSIVKDWDDGRRYDTVDELDARAFYGACAKPGSGIMEWIRRQW